MKRGLSGGDDGRRSLRELSGRCDSLGIKVDCRLRFDAVK